MLLQNEVFCLVPNLTYRGRCETRRFEVTSNQLNQNKQFLVTFSLDLATPRILVQVNKNTQLIVTPKLSSLISVMNHLVQGVEVPFFTPKSF